MGKRPLGRCRRCMNMAARRLHEHVQNSWPLDRCTHGRVIVHPGHAQETGSWPLERCMKQAYAHMARVTYQKSVVSMYVGTIVLLDFGAAFYITQSSSIPITNRANSNHNHCGSKVVRVFPTQCRVFPTQRGQTPSSTFQTTSAFVARGALIRPDDGGLCPF
jgi:hypothetical protein